MEIQQEIEQDYLLWVLFNQTRDAMTKVRERELQAQGISERHIQLLFIIKLIGHDATPSKIARWLLREPHSISELLNRMEKQGLIRKVKDLDRKNLVRIEMTEKGDDHYQRSFIPCSIPDTLSMLSEKERKQLIGLLMKLRGKALQNIDLNIEVPLPNISNL